MGSYLEAAKRLRGAMDAAGAMLTDQQASTVTALYPAMPCTGELIRAGMRINWRGTLKRAACDLWATEENNPANAPSLWEDVLYRKGHRIIPDVITAGLSFAKGECGWWKDALYESLLDNNVWTPDAHPDGWQRRDDE